MGVRIEAPKQDGNARFNSLKVNLQENLSATRNVVSDNDGNIYYGSVAGGSGFPFSGSAQITGSLGVTGSINVTNGGITGSLYGTSSWAVSASFVANSPTADTASYVTSSNVHGPFGPNSILSASYSVSSSYSKTSSYAFYSETASFVTASSVFGPFGSNSILSASYAVSTSYTNYAVTTSHALTASSADNFLVRGTLTAQTIVAQVITSSTEYITGSTIFGSQLTDTHQFTGSVSITGSLTVNNDSVVTLQQLNQATASLSSSIGYLSGSFLQASASFDTRINNLSSSLYSLSASFLSFSSSYNTGSFSGSFTGNLTGTASWATNFITSSVTSASFAQTASYVLNAISSSYAYTASSAVNSTNALTASFVQNAQSASYVLNAVSSSYAYTASSAISASRSDTSISSSYAFTASSATNAFNAISASYAYTASSAINSFNAISASYAYTASSATNSFNAISASYAFTASSAISASQANNAISASQASSANNAISASYAYTASSATNAFNAISSSYAFTASSAISASFSSNAAIATSASYAYTASSAVNAFNAISASYAFTASSAISASRANTAISASYSATSSLANLATTASHALSLPTNINITASNIQINSNLTVNGTASFNYVEQITGSAIIVGQEYIILNTQQPAARFAGLIIYDSGSNATASIVWDSERNHLVYQNTSGSGYTGGGFLSGPRNTGSLGQEPYPTLNRVVRGQGGDHLYDSNIIDDDTKVSITINTQVTGSLIVSNGITGSLFGTASWAQNFITSSVTSASYAFTASSAVNSFNAISASYSYTASSAINSFNAVSASYAFTASSAISASRANTTISSSYAFTASSAISASRSDSTISSSYAYTASSATNAFNAISASYAYTASSAISSFNAISASYAYTASSAINSTNALTASYVLNAVSSSYAFTASSAVNSFNATSASYSFTASSAINSFNAVSASYAYTASSAINSFNSISSSYAFTASSAISASRSDSSISASYAFTASSAVNSFNAVSASYAYTASSAVNATNAINSINAQTASSADNFLVRQSITASNALINGTITAQTLVVSTVSSSVVYSSGSNIFGNSLTNVQQFTGSVRMTGSLTVIGRATITDLTGSLFGTASWATNFITSSVTSASYAFTASSAVNSFNAVSASYAFTASSAVNSFNAISASYAFTASSAINSFNAVSSSYAFTASSATNAFNAISSSYAFTASSAINSFNAVSASYAFTASSAISSSFASTALFAPSYLPLTGGTMTGNITFTDDQEGIVWSRNTDGASIRFYNTGDGDVDSRLEFNTSDNNNEYFRWTHSPSGQALYESMKLTANTASAAILTVSGRVIAASFTGSLFGTASWAQNFITSSVTSASYAFTASSAVNSFNAISASYSFTASSAVNSFNAISASYAFTASSAVNSFNAISASYAFTASSAVNAFNSISASSASTASRALTASYVDPLIQTVYISGSLGIGTPTPTQKLELRDAAVALTLTPQTYAGSYRTSLGSRASAEGHLVLGNNGTNYIQAGTTAVGGTLSIYVNSTNDVNTAINGVMAMYFKADGNVGINTTAPSLAKLQVQGNVWAQSFTGSFSGSITSPGSNTQVIYNNSGVLAGSNNFIFDGTNVGIGTTSALDKLRVFGSAQDPNGVYIQVYNSFNGSAKSGIKFVNEYGGNVYSGSIYSNWFSQGIVLQANRDLTDSQGGFEFHTTTGTAVLVIRTSSGNVGIGTTTASQKLEVQGPTQIGNDNVLVSSLIFARKNTNQARANYYISSNDSPTQTWYEGALGTAENAGVSFAALRPYYESMIPAAGVKSFGFVNATSGSSFAASALTSSLVMSYTGLIYMAHNGGNVGIGTSSPVQKLDVYGNVSIGIPGATTVSSTYNSTTRNQIIYTNNSSFEFYEGVNERVRIAAGGNVGIGTTIPSVSVHVLRSTNATIGFRAENSIGAGGDAFSAFQAGSDFANNRFLNIGYANPGVVLSGAYRPTGSFIVSNGNGGLNFLATGSDGATHIRFFTSAATVGGVERMIIQDGGNVGIGTSTPTLAKLQVQGNVWALSYTGSFSGSVIAPGSNTQVIFNSSGSLAASNALVFTGANLGIGSSSPGYTLDVNGIARISGSSGALTYNGTLLNVQAAGFGQTVLTVKENNGSSGNVNVSFNSVSDPFLTLQMNTARSIAYLQYQDSAGSKTMQLGQTFPNGSNLTVSSSLQIGIDPNNTGTGIFQIVKGNSYNGRAGSDGTNLYRINNTGEAIWSVSGVEAMRLSSTSNLGIGTSSPTYKLHVSGNFYAYHDAFNYIKLDGVDLVMVANSAITIGDNSTDSVTIGAATGETRPTTIKGGPIYLQTNSTNRLFVAQDGNVGISTISPTLAKLQVEGNVWAQSFTGSLFGTASWAQNFITGSVTSASYAFTASSAVNSFNAISASYAFTASSAVNATNALTASSADNFLVRQSITASNALINGTITAQTLVVSTVSSSVVYSSGSNIFGNQLTNVQQFTGSLRVTGSGPHYIMGGSVGIGTTSPVRSLDILTSATPQIRISDGTPGTFWELYSTYFLSTQDFFIQNQNGAALTINASRSVGIGTTSPLVKLDVSGSVALAGTDGLRIGAVGDNSAYDNVKLYYTGYSAGSPRVYLTPRTTPGSGVVETYFHLLNTNGSSTTSNNTMGLLVDGNTAIGGVSTINARLHVSSSTGGVFRLDGVNGTAILYASASGNIGIGTTSPLTLLHVNGVASASAVSASSFTGDSYYGRAYTTFTDAGGGVAYFDTVTTSGAKLYEVSIIANPNSNGSSAYRDLLYGKIIIGTGFNGAAVTDFISYVQENPDPRSLYASGGGSLTVVARMVSGGVEYDQLATGTSYTIRIKISGYTVTGTSTTVRLKQIM